MDTIQPCILDRLTQSEQRIPMHKPMYVIQYWIDTGHQPYTKTSLNRSLSDTGSSLAEEDNLKFNCKKHVNTTKVNLSRKSTSKINKSINKYKKIINTSTSSIDTANYFLANKSNTYPEKNIDTIVFVEDYKCMNKKNSSEFINKNRSHQREMDEQIIHEPKHTESNYLQSMLYSDSDESIFTRNYTNNLKILNSQKHLSQNTSSNKVVNRKKLYKGTNSVVEFTAVSDGSSSSQNYRLPNKKGCFNHPVMQTAVNYCKSLSFIAEDKYKKRNSRPTSMMLLKYYKRKNNKYSLSVSKTMTSDICKTENNNENFKLNKHQSEFQHHKLKSARVPLYRLPYKYINSQNVHIFSNKSTCKELKYKDNTKNIKKSLNFNNKKPKKNVMSPDSENYSEKCIHFNQNSKIPNEKIYNNEFLEISRLSISSVQKKNHQYIKNDIIERKKLLDCEKAEDINFSNSNNSFNQSTTITPQKRKNKNIFKSHSKYVIAYSSDESELFVNTSKDIKITKNPNNISDRNKKLTRFLNRAFNKKLEFEDIFNKTRTLNFNLKKWLISKNKIFKDFDASMSALEYKNSANIDTELSISNMANKSLVSNKIKYKKNSLKIKTVPIKPIVGVKEKVLCTNIHNVSIHPFEIKELKNQNIQDNFDLSHPNKKKQKHLQKFNNIERPKITSLFQKSNHKNSLRFHNYNKLSKILVFNKKKKLHAVENSIASSLGKNLLNKNTWNKYSISNRQSFDKSTKNLNKLVLNFSNSSLNSNNLKDKSSIYHRAILDSKESSKALFKSSAEENIYNHKDRETVTKKRRKLRRKSYKENKTKKKKLSFNNSEKQVNAVVSSEEECVIYTMKN